MTATQKLQAAQYELQTMTEMGCYGKDEMARANRRVLAAYEAKLAEGRQAARKGR